MDIAREGNCSDPSPRSPASPGSRGDFELVNASSFGLLNAIFTRDLKEGIRFAELVLAGWVNINEGTNYWEFHLPFGGRAGSQSGLGWSAGAT